MHLSQGYIPAMRTHTSTLHGGAETSDRRGCKECPTGFRCPGGVDAADNALNAQPLALPGNIEDSETVYAALRCRSKAACPGEGIGCGLDLKGLVCDMCEPGLYLGRSMDVCEPCGNLWGFLIIGLVVVIVISFLGWVLVQKSPALELGRIFQQNPTFHYMAVYGSLLCSFMLALAYD